MLYGQRRHDKENGSAGMGEFGIDDHFFLLFAVSHEKTTGTTIFTLLG